MPNGRSPTAGSPRANQVTVHKLFVAGTVEERILDMLKKRRAGPVAAQASEEAKRAALKGKARAAEIAGAIKDDRQQLRLDDFDMLFS